MIDEKKDLIVGIVTYCDTEEKLDVLIKNIKSIRSSYPELKIAIQANYPLPVNVQQMVDVYVYENLNFLPDNKNINYWSIHTIR